MTNILLVCSMGLSTNMMAEAMEKSAKEQGIDVTIRAVPESKAPENADKADVILLGPQLSFKLDSMKKQYAGKPMACIEMRSYGMMDGKAALKQAMDLL